MCLPRTILHNNRSLEPLYTPLAQLPQTKKCVDIYFRRNFRKKCFTEFSSLKIPAGRLKFNPMKDYITTVILGLHNPL